MKRDFLNGLYFYNLNINKVKIEYYNYVSKQYFFKKILNEYEESKDVSEDSPSSAKASKKSLNSKLKIPEI